MQVYVAGSLHSRSGFILYCHYPHWLWSYADLKQNQRALEWKAALETGQAASLIQTHPQFIGTPPAFHTLAQQAIETYHPQGRSLILDSGAYSVWKQGRVLDIDEYCQFITAHFSDFNQYIMLDDITDPEQTLRNLEIMRARGLTPIPVFHPLQANSTDGLAELCQEYQTIAIGGTVGEPKESQEYWLRQCWKVFSRYFPIKVHLLGMMTGWALLRYPFYSCDTTSALIKSNYNGVLRFDGKSLRYEVLSQTHPQATKMRYFHEGTISNLHRQIYTLQEIKKYQNFLTDVWERRGITWQNDHS